MSGPSYLQHSGTVDQPAPTYYYTVDLTHDDGEVWHRLVELVLSDSDSLLVAVPRVRESSLPDLAEHLTETLSSMWSALEEESEPDDLGNPESNEAPYHVVKWSSGPAFETPWTRGELEPFVIERFSSRRWHQWLQPNAMPFCRLRLAPEVVEMIREIANIESWSAPEAPEDPTFFHGRTVLLWSVSHESEATILLNETLAAQLESEGTSLYNPQPSDGYGGPVGLPAE